MEKQNQKNATKEKLDIEKSLTYPENEDIYNQAEKLESVDPEDISKIKDSTEIGAYKLKNEKNFKDDFSGDDLDIPGAELDDEQEAIGSEDEENNYYSLGGDNHNDLEENND